MASTAPRSDRHSDAARGASRANAALAALAILALVLAGCASTQAHTPPSPTASGTGSATATGPPAPTETTPPGPPTTVPPVAIGPPAPPPLPRTELGEVASGKGINQTGACPCPPMRFQLDNTTVPGKRAWLELRVSWNGSRSAGVLPRLVAPEGNASLPTQRGFDDWRIQSYSPAAGDYSLDLDGSGDYTLQVRFLSLGEHRTAGTAILPNLVTLVPLDIHVAPCDAVETGEQGAKKCLRLSNGIGNLGDGPVEVHLAVDHAATALVAQLSAVGEGRFVQWIYNEDGTHTERDAGPAAFHVTHKHWHYAGLAHFQLFRYDPVTGLRGGEVTSHHKQGFCFLDWGMLNATDTDPSGGSNAQQNCQVPGDTGWSMGISRGYYDYYESGLTDEYVDVGGVPDGTYELVSTADGQRSLVELDPTDNSASIVLELHGDSVKLLEERGHYFPLEYPWSAHPA